MSIADKLTAVAENEKKVYDAGVTAEREKMWNTLQKNGGTQNVYYAYAYNRYTDETFNPIYPIYCSDGVNAGARAFYSAEYIKDTKVKICANANNANYFFTNCINLETIRLFSVYETTVLTDAFANCKALVNLTMDGTIGHDINLQWSTKLSYESIISVVNHLFYAAEGKTATFSKAAVQAAFGGLEMWDVYIEERPSWTFILV